MKKLLITFGTRPEAIKMCPLILELKKRSRFETYVCVTGQHRQMLDPVLAAFNVIPDFDLDIMKENQTLFDITNTVLIGMKKTIENVKPEILLVHGDTTTTFAAALAAFYMKIPVGHIEAGLRTYNVESPFPEEFNRQSVGIISKYNFAPTEKAKNNLIREGKRESSIFVTGNTAIDALKITVRRDYNHPLLDWLNNDKMILITAHRRENLDHLHDMFSAIKRVISEHDRLKAIYPIHFNPIVRKAAEEVFGNNNRVKIIEPLDVLDFHNLLARSYIVLTDSGGIQEEAPSLGVPVLVMRDTTERPEGIEAGTLKLVGTSEERIYNEFSELLNNKKKYEKMSIASNPYGDGHACEKIVSILENEL